GISPKFTRRFAEGIGKLAGNIPGDRRKKIGRLIARMPKAVGLTGVNRPYLGVRATEPPKSMGQMHLGHVNPSGRGSIITPIILSPAPREEASPRFSESAGEGLSNLESSCGVIRTFAWSSIARLLVGLKSSRLSCNHWVSRGKPSVEVKSSLEGMVGNRRPPTRLRARLEMIDTKSPWARLRAHLEMPRTKSPWARLRARLEVLETESP
ncbi:hypothetical protein BHE74_00035320, partial [Ensete ventricosum]